MFCADIDILICLCHSCLAQIIRNPPLPGCYLGNRNSCLGIARLKEDDNNMIVNVVFNQWVSVDRSTLERVNKSADESFCEKVEVEKPSTTTGHAYLLNTDVK